MASEPPCYAEDGTPANLPAAAWEALDLLRALERRWPVLPLPGLPTHEQTQSVIAKLEDALAPHFVAANVREGDEDA